MPADEIVSARDGGWRAVVVQYFVNDWFGGGWFPKAAWVCKHGTVWVGQRPPATCTCSCTKELTDAR